MIYRRLVLVIRCRRVFMILRNRVFFFFNDTATTEIYTLSLHDALPISVYMLGWGVPTLDALYSFQSLLASRGSAQGDGIWNFGLYSSPRMDALIARMKTGTGEARQAAIREALRLYREEVPHVPLHHQMIPWAVRSNIQVPHMANNQPYFRWAVVN